MDIGYCKFAHATTLIFIIVTVSARDYFEEHHRLQMKTQPEHLKEIPKQFDVKGKKAGAVFGKYVNDIQELASKKNVSVVYKVRVDTVVKNEHKNTNKPRRSKKSKKYNVPLKRKSMKLSNFEIISRKRANYFDLKQRSLDEMSTTAKQRVVYTTRQSALGKYKPDFGAVKTKYAKIVRPVRNKEIVWET